jgi:FkbM family methyltransferase
LALPSYLTSDRALLEAVSRRESRAVDLANDTLLCRILGRYFLYADGRDPEVSPRLSFDGFVQPGPTLALGRLLRPGFHCIDVGAGQGYFSLLMADAVGSNGRLLAIEPDPRLADLIRLSLRSNRLAADAAVAGPPELHTDGEAAALRGFSLDDLTVDWPQVDVVRIDARGLELHIWNGMKRIREQNRGLAILLQFNAPPHPSDSEFLSLLAEDGYRLTLIEANGEVKPISPRELNTIADLQDAVLLLRRPTSGEQPTARSTETLSYCKVCNIDDFATPEIARVIREVFADEIQTWGLDYPVNREHRKQWEIAMAIRTLADYGVLRPDAEILGVGAGTETTIFWLTRLVRRVFATDLYLDPGTWEDVASKSMLSEPEFVSFEWNPRRLVVQHMNALDLRYEDNSFDGIFSTSSIEHFGTPADVASAAQEMYRVLRPGGILSLATEFRLEGPSPGVPGTLMFDSEELSEWIVGDRGWTLLSPLDLTVSERTADTEVLFESVLSGVARLPHVVLRMGAHVWTSVHLALRKRE